MVEYSELDPSLASAINQVTGRLRFCWSNVMSHPLLFSGIVLLTYITFLVSSQLFTSAGFEVIFAWTKTNS